jgi:hypothetical protein
MSDIHSSLKYKLIGNLERVRVMERPLEAFSRKLWPWSEAKLVFWVGLLAVLDYTSTWAFLTYGHPQAGEGGLIAGWALQTGGFLKLLLVDAVSVGGLILMGLGIRWMYCRLGICGLGRTALVFLLLPYFVVIMAVIFNNIFWALAWI